MYKLLGTEPALKRLEKPTGDVARVPPFNEEEFLVAPDFKAPVPLLAASTGSRPRAGGPRRCSKARQLRRGLDGDHAVLGFATGLGPLKFAQGRKPCWPRKCESVFGDFQGHN